MFRIGDLVAMAGGDFEDLALLVSHLGQSPAAQGQGLRPMCQWNRMCCVQGGAVGISVRWDCNLDTKGSDCCPQYSFQLQERGYNFRYGSSCCAGCCSWSSAPPPIALSPPGQSTPSSDSGSLLCIQDPGTFPVPGSTPLPSLACSPPADLFLVSPR